MTEKRNISFHVQGDVDFTNPIWAVSDTAVPAVGDSITIEAADDSLSAYKVVRRNWMTAKQGAHSFTQVRLIVEKVEGPWFL